jgi:hypothetical protein
MLALYVKRLSMSIGNSLETTGNLNIRIHRDIEGNVWFGVWWGRMKVNLGKLKSIYYQSHFCFLQIFC